MYKKKKIKDEVLIYILLIMLVLVFILTGLSKTMKDFFNVIGEKIYLVKDKNIIIKDDVTKDYINDLESEIKELKSIMKVDNSNEYRCINASVIYREPTYWYNNLTINKGKNDGIKENDMVIDKNGLIGIVGEVLNNSSTITLLTNISNKSKITVGINYEEDIIYGLIGNYDLNKNEIIITEITSDIELTDKMEVYTTSFTNTFKSGISIGKVKEIKEDSKGLSKIAIVKPNADFNNIKYVCVMAEK